MVKRYQKGDAGAAMLVLMVVLMAGWLWHDGHGRSNYGHMSGTPSATQTDKTALQTLDEAYARGDITREEYLRKRDDLKSP